MGNQYLLKPLVCVLAYNEEAGIINTLQHLLRGNEEKLAGIIVYANGCTDQTIPLVKAFLIKNPLVRLREIAAASKINAWNTAFRENENEVIIFCDGDVEPAEHYVEKFLKSDEETKHQMSIISAKLLPRGRALTGLMQLPLYHQYLTGGLYWVNRPLLLKKLQEKNIQELPFGLLGEDAFLDRLVSPDGLFISSAVVFYGPPRLSEYVRYLARIKWQNDQLNFHYGNIVGPLKASFVEKIMKQESLLYFLVAIFGVFLRTLFKLIMRKKIMQAYRKFGPISSKGDQILTHLSRAHSSKESSF